MMLFFPGPMGQTTANILKFKLLGDTNEQN